MCGPVNRTVWIALLAGCTKDAADTDPWAFGCGDGVVGADERCDDGAANSDTAPDACRTTCVPAACGDGVVDGGEACDDGAARGGDGCDAACQPEVGVGEVEPNDTPAGAPAAGDRVNGALDADDVDCWTLDVASCDAVSAAEVGPCDATVRITLRDPTGATRAVGAPGEDGCAVLAPADQPAARWCEPGAWAVCVDAIRGVPVAGYAVDVAVGPTADLGLGATGETDLDGDTFPDQCDDDRDGDGVDDVDDTCVDVSNGPTTPAPALSGTGYVRHWLIAGPYGGTSTTGGCRPSTDALVDEDAADFAPTMGDAAGSKVWRAALLREDRLDMLGPFGTIGPAREAYALVYLWSDTARTVKLSVGADDGVFAWWNDVQVLDVAGCQGTNPDQFQADVAVVAGWNTALFKVRDQGGGWGLMARFVDGAGAPVTDLRPSLVPETAWIPDQADTDGDGRGDVCDSD